MSKPINIVDLFAGPGGLGEGFSSYKVNKQPAFKIRVSVEKEPSAHETLTLRALYRNLTSKKHKNIYHDYVAGNITQDEMIGALPLEWASAREETLNNPSALGEDNDTIHKRLRQIKAERPSESWIVMGGPPCQAYSLVGRSRNKGKKGYSAKADKRHFLYQEYLEVLNIIQPDVFVMENVKGILTSKIEGERLFPKIRTDLEHPAAAIKGSATRAGKKYKIYSFVTPPEDRTLFGPNYTSDSSFIIRAERFGIPQARHRVILFGVWEDIEKEPTFLEEQPTINIEHILTGLPPVRSKISKGLDSPEGWSAAILKQAQAIQKQSQAGSELRKVANRMVRAAKKVRDDAATIGRKYTSKSPVSIKVGKELRTWLVHDKPATVLNHESRGHIPEDLGRYLFCSCWAEEYKDEDISIPKAKDFPELLRPNHANWQSGHFADRFRVQAKGRPATTITSHISKDGHYYIHFDAKQCRSLTVREAARIQTFPDNYYFEGNRTQQYVQVGNAVPPFLARKLAKIVYKLFK